MDVRFSHGMIPSYKDCNNPSRHNITLTKPMKPEAIDDRTHNIIDGTFLSGIDQVFIAEIKNSIHLS
jgi:hypothetical protein